MWDEIEVYNMTYRSGYGFPRDVYFDTARMQTLFESKWFFVGTRGDVPKLRNYFKFDLMRDSYILIHGSDGIIRCFVNRCAHQSARLVNEATGKCGARIICPNHQWAFDLNSGDLVHASGMPSDFVGSKDGKDIHLDEIALREVDGLLFACLGDAPSQTDLDVISKLMAPYTSPFGLGADNYKLAYHEREIIEASWLSVMINNRECNHCAQNHKQLLQLFDASSFNGAMTPDYKALLTKAQKRWDKKGLKWEEQAFTTSEDCRVARYPLADGYKSITFDGAPASKKLIGPHIDTGYDEGTLSIWLNPNAWIHMTSDHIATNWVLPLDSFRCVLFTSWIVHKDAVEGVDYTEDHMTDVWRVTNGEDVALCESMSAGTRSKHYRPGPFSEDEKFCTQFTDWYMKHSAEH